MDMRSRTRGLRALAGLAAVCVATAAVAQSGPLKTAVDGTFAPHVEVPSGESPVRLAVADVDGDGDLDLVVQVDAPAQLRPQSWVGQRFALHASASGKALLATYDDGRLRYAGNVGTGFTHAFLADLLAHLQELQAPKPMFEGFEGTPRPRGARFVRPELVCEVEYLKWTQDDKLRAASFKGLRPDKPPADCVREDPVELPR